MSADPSDLKYVSEAELVSVREQIQEDIISCMSATPLETLDYDGLCDNLCDCVVKNFKRL